METITEVKERPILFSTPMIQAILEGRKTVTRRIVKFPPDFDGETIYQNPPFGIKYQKTDSTVWRLACPYGCDGDILWVRETWQKSYNAEASDAAGIGPIVGPYYIYKSDYPCIKHGWKPSIHMPRAACRLRLEIVSIRVERLHDITEEDAKKEGAPDTLKVDDLKACRNLDWVIPTHQFGFLALWCKINGAESWKANPFVWRIEFKKL